VSNGPTEAVNALMKIKSIGRRGYRNLDNYRLRLPLHGGVDWQPGGRQRVERLLAKLGP
jgi:hypothetical protein